MQSLITLGVILLDFHFRKRLVAQGSCSVCSPSKQKFTVGGNPRNKLGITAGTIRVASLSTYLDDIEGISLYYSRSTDADYQYLL